MTKLYGVLAILSAIELNDLKYKQGKTACLEQVLA